MKAIIIPICEMYNPEYKILSEETIEKLKKRGYRKGKPQYYKIYDYFLMKLFDNLNEYLDEVGYLVENDIDFIVGMGYYRDVTKGVFYFLSPVSNKPNWTNEELKQAEEFYFRKIQEQKIVRKVRKYLGNSFVTKWLGKFILDGSYEKLRTIIDDISVIIFRIFYILTLCITLLIMLYLLYLSNK